MAKTTDELFAEATEADYETAEPVTLAASDTEEEFQFRIDEHLRTIAIPEKGVVAGVEGDLNVNIARFTMTRYYHGRDLSKLNIRINYRNANGQVNYYTVSDATASGDSIIFSWEFAADVTQYKGNVQFVVYLFSATNAVLKQRFFTTLGTLEVLEGLEVDSFIPVSEQTDILLHLKKDLSAYAEEVKKSLPADYTAMTEQVSSLKEDLSQLSEETATLREDLNALRDGETADSYNYIGDLPQTPNFRPVYLLASEDTVLTIGENLCFGLESRLIDGSVNPYTGNTVFYTNCIDVVFNDTNGVTFTQNGTIWQNAYLLFAIPAEVGKTYTVSAEYTDAYMRLAETDAIEGNIDLSNFSSYAEVNSNGRYATSLTASKAYVLIQTFTKNNATTTINKVAVTDDGTTAYSESKTINLTGGSYTEYVNTVGELIPAGSVPIGLYQKISSGSGETDLSAVYDYVDEKLETKLDRSGYTESGNLIVNEDGEVMIQEDANEVYVFLGDSIPTFDANTGGDGAIPDYMQKLIGGTWHNFGIGGTTMASYTSSNNTYDMFTFGELADSIASGDFTNQEIGVTNGVGAGSTDYSPSEKVADMKVLDWSMVNTIFAHFGTNDLAYGNSVGGVDDVASKNGTMVASLKYAINKILSTYPTMKIVICGIIYRYADNPSVSSIISANKVIKESCESIGVPYVDLFSKMCVNQSNKDSFLYDGTHPNENGKVRYAECLAKEVF